MNILRVGKTVILRQPTFWGEEPTQVYGVIKEIRPNITLTDRIRGGCPVDVVVATEKLGPVRVRRVHSGNVDLVFDPCFLK